MKEAMKRKGVRVGIAVVVLAVLAAAYWYGVYYKGVSSIGLHTAQADTLVDTLTQQDGSVDKTKVYYRFPGCVEIVCYGDNLEQEAVLDMVDTMKQAVRQESFQISFTKAYDRRYGTHGAPLESVMVYVYNGGEELPAWRFSSRAPFQEWMEIN